MDIEIPMQKILYVSIRFHLQNMVLGIPKYCTLNQKMHTHNNNQGIYESSKLVEKYESLMVLLLGLILNFILLRNL